MTTESGNILPVRGDADIVLARMKGERLARSIGMEKVQVADVAIAVSELASNLVKHRVTGGKIIIHEIVREGNKGIEVISSDLGPGIPDTDQAMTDGYSTAGSLGIGLPAVNRLMDEFQIRSNTVEGTLVTTRKWVKPDLPYMSVPELDLSIFSRPLPGQRYNGDAYFVKRYEDKVTFARYRWLRAWARCPRGSTGCFTEIFQLCHQRLKRTRGAAMSLCRINLKNRVMTHAGIGNVNTRVYSSEKAPAPFCINGTLGVAMRTVKVDDYPLPENSTIIMFSDGISGRFSPNNLPGLLRLKPQSLGKRIMDNYARDNDDATIIVGRSRS